MKEVVAGGRVFVVEDCLHCCQRRSNHRRGQTYRHTELYWWGARGVTLVISGAGIYP